MENRKKFSKWIFLIPIILFFSLFFLNNKSKETIKTEINVTPKMEASASASASPSAVSLLPIPSEAPRIISSTGIPILTYHYITNNPNPEDVARNSLEVPPDKFEEQMIYLSTNGYSPITLDTLYAILSGQVAKPSKPIVLTFDDGYIDFYTNAFPVLRRFNFHSVSFVPTGLIGTGYYMNWDQIKEIQATGLVTFEDHSVTHPNLVGLSYDDILKQMVESKNILQAQTGYPVNFIAYPYGASNGFVQQAAREAGFVGGVGTYFGKVGEISLNMPRIKVSGFWNINEFASRL